MLRTNFQNELNDLHVELDKMCHLVTEAIDNCVYAFKHQDLALAKEIIENDEVINDHERRIEAKCLKLILREQPIATDLRDISTALKVVTDLERIGDQAADIAEILIESGDENTYRMVEHIPAMAKATKKMVNEAIDAFHRRDVEAANSIKESDKIVDELYDTVRQEVVSIIIETPDNADFTVNFLMVAKYFERIGDHAANICEWVQFNQTGKVANTRLL